MPYGCSFFSALLYTSRVIVKVVLSNSNLLFSNQFSLRVFYFFDRCFFLYAFDTNDWIDLSLLHSRTLSELYILSNFRTQYVQRRHWLALAIQLIWDFHVLACIFIIFNVSSSRIFVQTKRAFLARQPNIKSMHIHLHVFGGICIRSNVRYIVGMRCVLFSQSTTRLVDFMLNESTLILSFSEIYFHSLETIFVITTVWPCMHTYILLR